MKTVALSGFEEERLVGMWLAANCRWHLVAAPT